MSDDEPKLNPKQSSAMKRVFFAVPLPKHAIHRISSWVGHHDAPPSAPAIGGAASESLKHHHRLHQHPTLLQQASSTDQAYDARSTSVVSLHTQQRPSHTGAEQAKASFHTEASHASSSARAQTLHGAETQSSSTLHNTLPAHLKKKQFQVLKRELRLVPPQNYHLTLFFIGNVAVEQLPALTQHVRSAVGHNWPRHLNELSITVGPQPGYFGSRHKPRVFFLGVQCDPLPQLAAIIQDAAQAFRPAAPAGSERHKARKRNHPAQSSAMAAKNTAATSDVDGPVLPQAAPATVDDVGAASHQSTRHDASNRGNAGSSEKFDNDQDQTSKRSEGPRPVSLHMTIGRFRTHIRGHRSNVIKAVEAMSATESLDLEGTPTECQAASSTGDIACRSSDTDIRSSYALNLPPPQVTFSTKQFVLMESTSNQHGGVVYKPLCVFPLAAD